MIDNSYLSIMWLLNRLTVFYKKNKIFIELVNPKIRKLKREPNSNQIDVPRFDFD